MRAFPVPRLVVRVLGLTLLAALSAAAAALPRATPEEQGVSSAGVLKFLDAADRQVEGMHSFMLVRRGKVVAEAWWGPYDAATPHLLYSLSKSFTSIGVGIAVGEGKLSRDAEVLAAFADRGPADPSGPLKQMRLRDLLRMGTGHATEPPMWGGMTVSNFLAHPVAFKPGTHFLYNTPATFMASALLQRATGQTLLEYLQPRLFDPLGIPAPTWPTNREGITLGGYGLSLRTEEIAKFGQLLLQEGRWEGKQLVPADWVREATSLQIANGSNPRSDWDQGYGYQFWRSRNGAYRGDGAFGQYCVVLPQQEAVVAITSGTGNMQLVLDLLWEHLLPALNGGGADGAAAELARRSKSLRLPTPRGGAAPGALKTWEGTTYALGTNSLGLEGLALTAPAAGDAVTLVATLGGVEQRLPVGLGEWRASRISGLGGEASQPIALAGAWNDEVLTVQGWLTATPFRLQLKIRRDGETLRVEPEWNVFFGPTRLPELVGRIP